MIASIDSLLSSSTTSSTTTTSTEANDSMDKEDFLNLFVTQLKNQDPLDPQDNTEACAQLAQYSELEAMLDVKTGMEELKTAVTSIIPELNSSVQYNTGLSLIGCNVRVEQTSATWYGDTDEPVSMNVNATAGETVTVNMVDDEDNVVRTLSAVADENGVATLTWDGTDEDGNVVDVGQYEIQVDGSDTDSTLYSFIEGTVEGASSRDNKAMVRIDGTLFPVSKLVDVSYSSI